ETQPPEHVAFDVEVAGDAAARLVHLVRRTKTGKHLRADRGAVTESIRHAAVCVRARLARVYLVVLAAVFRTDGDVERAGEAADGEGTAHVDVAHELVQFQRAGIELGLVGRKGRTKRHVQRVVDR